MSVVMQPQQRELTPPTEADVMSYGAGLVIRQYAGLSGEDKWAWRLLWILSRQGRELVKITPTEIGADQGVSETSGRRRIESLADKHGLIRLHHTCPKTGRRTIEVFDPRDVLGVVAPDPQPTLFDDSHRPLSESQLIGSGDAPRRLKIIDASATEPPAEALAEPPAEASPRASGPSGLSAPLVLQEISTDHRPSVTPSGPSARASTAKDQGRDGTAGGSVADGERSLDELNREIYARRKELGLAPDGNRGTEPQPIAAHIVASAVVARMPDERTLSRRREAWIDTIRRRVNDPRLKVCVMVKVASAVVDGDLKSDQVTEVFDQLDAHRRGGSLRSPAGVYFLRAAQELFRRAGIKWEKKPRPT